MPLAASRARSPKALSFGRRISMRDVRIRRSKSGQNSFSMSHYCPPSHEPRPGETLQSFLARCAELDVEGFKFKVLSHEEAPERSRSLDLRRRSANRRCCLAHSAEPDFTLVEYSPVIRSAFSSPSKDVPTEIHVAMTPGVQAFHSRYSR